MFVLSSGGYIVPLRGLVLGGATALLLFGNFNTENEPRMSDAVAIAYVITDYTDATIPREIAMSQKAIHRPAFRLNNEATAKRLFCPSRLNSKMVIG